MILKAVGYFLLSVARVADLIVDLYTFMILLAVLLSWVRPDPYNPIVRFLSLCTEPALRLGRRLIPSFLRYRLPIDLSPLIVLILLVFVETFLLGLLRDFAITIIGK